jgi:hypothetical protein
MTNADTGFREDLEAARVTNHALWQRACTVEQAAWELYRGKNFDYQAAWQAANDVRLKTQIAFDQIDKACKAVANMTAGASGTESTP